jgi:subtilisin family serine protease
VDAFYRVIHDGPVSTRFNFSNSVLFRGASIEITDPSVAETTLKNIKAMSNVQTWPVRKIPRPAPMIHWAGSPAESNKASSLKRRRDHDGEDDKKKKDDKKLGKKKDDDDDNDDTDNDDTDNDDTDNEDAPEADNLSVHIQTQVDKLRAEGYTGKGIKVLIIDTGVSCEHLLSIFFSSLITAFTLLPASC